jgi:excinuclease ABC subunit A
MTTKQDFIVIEGARQNNLKGLNLKLPLNKLIVVTGVSGSGKSSLAFDTIYAEGQRRYVETFSSYARQFLDRMDRPKVDRIEGIPPAIAIDQANPVRTSRSTVGTMTEINDHLKLLFARTATLVCGKCNRPVHRDTPDTIFEKLIDRKSAIITFRVKIPENFARDEMVSLLSAQGYTRILREDAHSMDVIQDRLTIDAPNRGRIIEDLEAALKHGNGTVSIHEVNDRLEILSSLRFSSGLHCPDCDIQYKEATQGLFSFNSPVGACETCRGFGRVIGVDYDLVIPDQGKTLRGGAIRPWQTKSYSECQDELTSFARKRKIPVDTPWQSLTESQKTWVLEGEGPWEDGVWYGVRRFFEWLESRAYKMHIRVLLSRYRAYRLCPSCGGARLKPEALMWRVGGQSLHDIALLPLDKCLAFFESQRNSGIANEAGSLILKEILTRLQYLVEVGLGYLTLDRQSRTLSGGEVQRINLTTALGTSLVNSLFVLDEPSIGLHSRDIGRLVSVLLRLRDAGNTLIVVEHDPEVIRAADFVIDMGPGPGEAGGQIVCFDDLQGLMKSPDSITARYLRKRKNGNNTVAVDLYTSGPSIEIKGAKEHNLKNIDVEIPLKRLVCLTGVSGSGKSTLLHDIAYLALKKLKGKGSESPGSHDSIKGGDLIDEVVMVDQSPIGRTTRSNPASYVGAFDDIRKAFSLVPEAKTRKYTAGTFSFNSGLGRCPACGGNGFEHVEMQFLSDVYLRCPDCNGKRYRPEVLEIKISGKGNESSQSGKSISDVLEMTVTEAISFFSDFPAIIRSLGPLRSVGLAYMRMGQPLPTLSGGEAQRLKLAGHLARNNSAVKGKGSLFMFDEPTTGLHLADIEVLMNAFRSLISAGHSVVVIEHNLEVIQGADWIIDLGPEGGEAGGRVVCSGEPHIVKLCGKSHTGRALVGYESPFLGRAGRPQAQKPGGKDKNRPSIVIKKAREHNLRDIDISIPRNAFTVITGVSGSGKSTVAFDILFAEGQRRYLESLNAYSRQFVQPASRPDVDGVFGIPPTVAIEQRTSRGGRKSTVATVTEIYHFLRLLFVKLGTQYCPGCHLPIEPSSPEAILADVMRNYRGSKVSIRAPLVVNRKGYYTDMATWARAKGFAELIVDGKPVSTGAWPRLDRYKEHTIELPVGSCTVAPDAEATLRGMIDTALSHGEGVLSIANSAKKKEVFSTLRACPQCHKSFEEPDPRLLSFNSRHGWCAQCFGTGLEMKGFDEEQTGEEIWWNEWWDNETRVRTCAQCNGKRLRPEALSVLLDGKSISDVTALSVGEASDAIARLHFDGRKNEIAKDIMAELSSRLDFLARVGLEYISLDRSAPTLSGGEAQRIRLAAQLGSNLKGVCYVLDEPTIGLHPADSSRLLDTLFTLKNKGNTVVVVEHDEATIRSADYVLDLGPGGGALGGRLIASGTPAQVLKNPQSVTGIYLKKPRFHEGNKRPVSADTPRLMIRSAKLHNLKNIDVGIPLGRFVCVAGVSGSGKSTLVRDVLYKNIRRILSGKSGRSSLHGCENISGLENIDKALEVDQTPIGKTPRSCPATYIGFWDDIRKIFSRTQEAAIRGFSPSRFSFNTRGGRCDACEGQGMKKIEMNFLPDVSVLCEACGGARFTPETLEVRFKDKTIAEALAMSVDEAVGFFAAHRSIHKALLLLQETGLGYLHLGQQSPTLSGGEAQRIKLVTELQKSSGRVSPRQTEGKLATVKKAVYVLDEPTIGLHMADVEKLLHVLHKLVDDGNTVIVIEHNLDVIAEADWIIDLGPGGGGAGGSIVAQGPPSEIIQVKKSQTAMFLKKSFVVAEKGGGKV